MATKLGIYNRALVRVLGERKVLSVTEDREPARLLSTVWDDGFVRSVLEMGQWNFAARTREISYNPSVEPDFGYQRAFDKPSDWVRTCRLSADEYFSVPLLHNDDDMDYWFCDENTIYVRYISDDSSYGGDLSKWPESFANFAAHQLALEVVNAITSSATTAERLEKKTAKMLTRARSMDAMNQPPSFSAPGSWVSARYGGSGKVDRGSRGSLIG